MQSRHLTAAAGCGRMVTQLVPKEKFMRLLEEVKGTGEATFAIIKDHIGVR